MSFIQPHMSRLQFDLELVDEKGLSKGESYIQHYCQGIMQAGDLRNTVFQNQLMAIPTSGNLFSRSILEKILPMPEEQWKICSDAYLIWLSAFYGPVISVYKVLGSYRLHNHNQWASLKEGALSTIIKKILLQQKIYSLIQERFPFFKDQLAKLQCLIHYDIELLKTKVLSFLLEPNCSRSTDTRFQLLKKGLYLLWLQPNRRSLISKLRSTIWFFLMSLPLFLIRPLAFKLQQRLPFQPSLTNLPPFSR